MSETITQIKEKLAQIHDAQDAYVLQLRKDERAGVQKLIQQFENRLAKEQAMINKAKTMRQFENELLAKGYQAICGIDEVGRGPLAGPVVAAAVILPNDELILGLNDSKQLSEKKRESLYQIIQEKAVAIGIGVVDETTIDAINIYQAARLAMTKAVEQLAVQPDYLLIDAMELDLDIQQISLIKGDARSQSIAAASIIAKVYRDHLMVELDKQYPGYGFGKNAGYGTKEHLEGLEKYGVTPIHRKTFAPIKDMI